MSHDTSEDIYGTNYRDVIRGYGGHDLIYGRGGNDDLFGDTGDDDLYGESGNDYLNGGDGWDILDGGSGNDRLIGGYGDDDLYGGSGKDTLTGDLGSYASGVAGSDVFVFERVSDSYAGATSRDVITDFRQYNPANPSQQHDLIDLEDIDARPGYTQDDFRFVGTDFAGAGELRYYQEGGKTIIQGNIDNDAAIEFEIELNGLYNLKASDFDL